jgi:hypothetical protein
VSDKLQRCPNCQAVIGAEESTCPACKTVLVEQPAPLRMPPAPKIVGKGPEGGALLRTRSLPGRRQRDPWDATAYFGWGFLIALIGGIIGGAIDQSDSSGSSYGWAFVGVSIGAVLWTIGIVAKGVEVGVRAVRRRP